MPERWEITEIQELLESAHMELVHELGTAEAKDFLQQLRVADDHIQKAITALDKAGKLIPNVEG